MGIWYVAGIPYSSDELYHHGIKGQKWGVRRFQNEDGTLTDQGIARYRTGSRKDIQRSLNVLDQNRATTIYNKSNAETKLARLTKKANKMEKRGKTVSDKMNEKIKNTSEEIERYNNSLKSYKDLSDSILGKAAASGYTINMKGTKRSVTNGRDAALTVLGAFGGVVVMPAQVYGTKYKVRERKG